MLERINQDIKTAMKSRNKPKLEALRFLKSKLLENKTAKKPIAELDVVISHVKKLKDSLTNFPEGSDLLSNTQTEIENLSDYLPQPLTEGEVRTIIEGIISSNEGAHMGVVMKELTGQIKGKFDGRRASEMVKELLSK
ncbi:MAG: GatB/YqeY domain-containing protein [Bacteriovoracaceae bacterium]|jgi:uncharacterized protein|nr:GatB/YqeY domain-containing protein [Bacteriovoracaceae bacterium]